MMDVVHEHNHMRAHVIAFVFNVHHRKPWPLMHSSILTIRLAEENCWFKFAMAATIEKGFDLGVRIG
jgi:hypothetical protein